MTVKFQTQLALLCMLLIFNVSNKKICRSSKQSICTYTMLLVDVTDDEDDTEPTKKENEMDTEWKKKMTTIPL